MKDGAPTGHSVRALDVWRSVSRGSTTMCTCPNRPSATAARCLHPRWSVSPRRACSLQPMYVLCTCISLLQYAQGRLYCIPTLLLIVHTPTHTLDTTAAAKAPRSFLGASSGAACPAIAARRRVHHSNGNSPVLRCRATLHCPSRVVPRIAPPIVLVSVAPINMAPSHHHHYHRHHQPLCRRRYQRVGNRALQISA